jgi:hypothetical protein
MDSISIQLTPLDEINIYCPAHESPAIGVCGDNLCKEHKFYCMKCAKSKDSCISQSNHELVCLSELLYRFFVKQETKTINLAEINNMIDAIKDTDRLEITKSLSDFTRSVENNLASSMSSLSSKIKSKLESTNVDIIKTTTKINNTLSNALTDEENISKLEKIPEIFFNINPQIIKDYLKSEKIQLSEKNDMIKTIKFLSDTDSLTSTVSAADDLISIHKNTTNEGKTEYETKFEEKLREIENKFNKGIEEIEKVIIPSKDNLIISKPGLTKFISDPNNLIFKKDICDTAHKSNSIDSVFCTFKSLKGDHFVVWGTPTYNIEVYDLKKGAITKTITSAHSNTIFSCRHYLDKKAKRDLLITSSYDKSVKVWDVKNDWAVILNIQAAHTGFYIYSVCVLSDEFEGKNYVISAAPNEFTKVWDFNAKFIRDFGVNSESTYFINCWCDTKAKKYYILNANSADVKSYDFKTGLLYKTYKATPQTWHMSALVFELNNIYQLIESDGNGNIRIWDFHQATLLKTIPTSGINLRGICLWNDTYLFSAGSDYNVKLYDLKSSTTAVKSLTGHSSTVCAVDKINHPTYGECLISHALDGKLKLWSSK